jgi:Coenzyme PQQ synthesis protein D (PqqD)
MERSSTWLSSYDIGTGVVSRLIGDETVLVHLGSEMYYGLNRTGSVVWAELEKRTPIPDIIKVIVDRFDVSTERAAADVRALLGELERLGLARRSA